MTDSSKVDPVLYSSHGARLIAAERHRQVVEEGWTAEHDAALRDGELAAAAVAYARYGSNPRFAVNPPLCWPWSASWWKPGRPEQNLAKAGALLAAEIDRVVRAAEPKSAYAIEISRLALGRKR